LKPYRERLLPDFPLGTDFNEIEQLLLPALVKLSEAASSKPALAGLLWASLAATAHPQEIAAMKRMGFAGQSSLFEPLQSRALRGALRKLFL
jgi:hypothetical protein